eukprot:8240764-Alexandrium_andersonii.AAC.1
MKSCMGESQRPLEAEAASLRTGSAKSLAAEAAVEASASEVSGSAERPTMAWRSPGQRRCRVILGVRLGL